MPQFKNLTQLDVYLKKLIKNSMEDVGKVVENKTREKIDEVVYQANTPSQYERTRELQNSLIHTQPKQFDNETVVEVKHDDAMFGWYEPNQHISVLSGDELPVEVLAEIVNDGKAGHIFGEGFWTKPRPYIEESLEEIKKDKLHIKAMKDSLKSKGIKVE